MITLTQRQTQENKINKLIDLVLELEKKDKLTTVRFSKLIILLTNKLTELLSIEIDEEFEFIEMDRIGKQNAIEDMEEKEEKKETKITKEILSQYSLDGDFLKMNNSFDGAYSIIKLLKDNNSKVKVYFLDGTLCGSHINTLDFMNKRWKDIKEHLISLNEMK